MKKSVVFAVCLWAALGCKPGAGSSCEKGEARCIDAKRQLVCREGKFIESPCSGPGGCALGGKGKTICDFSTNKPGDACSTDDEGAGVCAKGSIDGRGRMDKMIVCRAGKYQFVPCRGSQGCDSWMTCSQSIAMLGDACMHENKKVCAVDGRSVLLCHDNEMELLLSCRGPGGCYNGGGFLPQVGVVRLAGGDPVAHVGGVDRRARELDCDMSIAKLGDPCDKTQEGRVSCSEDASSTLICRGQRFVLGETCKPKTKCVTEGTRLKTGVAEGTQCAQPEKE